MIRTLPIAFDAFGISQATEAKMVLINDGLAMNNSLPMAGAQGIRI